MSEGGFTRTIEVDGLTADEIFAVLGNETRLDIVSALWDAGAHHQYADLDPTDRAISFSELRRAVDVRDNGRFNYHLSKLVPHLVRHTDDGYRLSGAGMRIAQAVVAISGTPEPDGFEEHELPCPLCTGPLTFTYEDQWVEFSCPTCGDVDENVPEGTIFNTVFPAAGLSDRTPDEVLSTGLYRCMLDLTYLMRGICRDCASPTTASVLACESHDVADDRACAACGSEYAVWADISCDTCRFAKRLPIEICVMGLTPVIAFLHEREFDALSPSFAEIDEVIETRFRTDVARDPLRVTVTVADGADELSVTFDGGLTLLDVAP